jgi:hypothetical protein
MKYIQGLFQSWLGTTNLALREISRISYKLYQEFVDGISVVAMVEICKVAEA